MGRRAEIWAPGNRRSPCQPPATGLSEVRCGGWRRRFLGWSTLSRINIGNQALCRSHEDARFALARGGVAQSIPGRPAVRWRAPKTRMPILIARTGAGAAFTPEANAGSPALVQRTAPKRPSQVATIVDQHRDSVVRYYSYCFAVDEDADQAALAVAP